MHNRSRKGLSALLVVVGVCLSLNAPGAQTWYPLGDPVWWRAFEPTQNPYDGYASSPSIGFASIGTPYIAWREMHFGNCLICPWYTHLTYWDGAAWQGLPAVRGGRTSSIIEQSARLALDSIDRAVVVAKEPSRDHWGVQVYRYSGDWEQLGVVNDVDSYGRDGAQAGLILDGSDNPIVAWSQTNRAGTTAILVKRFDGKSWVPMGGPIGEPERGAPSCPTLATDANGQPVLAHLEAPSTVHLRRWNGSEWRHAGEAKGEGAFGCPALGATSDGDVIAAWTAGDPERTIRVQKFGANAYQTTTPYGFSPTDPALAITPDDRPAVAWIEHVHDEYQTPLFSFARIFDGKTWQDMGDGLGTGSEYISPGGKLFPPSIAFGPDGQATFAWSRKVESFDKIVIEQLTGP